MSDVEPIRTAPLALWTIAQSFLNTLYALFGGPERIAFQHTHTGAQRALVLPWLRAGEALMRRLLLIEASAYPKPNTRPLLRASRKRVRRMVGFEDDKPETWRVSFRCFSAPASRSRSERVKNNLGGSGSRQSRETKGAIQAQMLNGERVTAPSVSSADSSPACGGAKSDGRSRFDRDWPIAKPAKFYAARPLAERYEALLRVFNNPAPFAKRLAVRLHALAHRARELLRLPLRKRPRRSGEVGETENLIPDFATLDAAARAVCDSS